MATVASSNVVKGKIWARDARTPAQLMHRAKWKVLGLLSLRMKKVLELGFETLWLGNFQKNKG